MNSLFHNISIDYENTMIECAKVLMENLKKKSVTESEEDNLSQYLKVYPDKIGYVDQMRDRLCATKDAICKMNDKLLPKYQDAAEKINPIGLGIRKGERIATDDDIKAQYSACRTVVLDKFNEMAKIDHLNEGGEGWVKFIDTLATPEERIENYKVPQFDSTYTIFHKHKEVDKVTKPDLVKAIKTICDYDRQMGQIIADSKCCCESRDKMVELYSQKGPALSIREAANCLAEVMLIIETDYLDAQCLEARSYALLEEVKMAHRVLYGLTRHNPRNIKESSLDVDMGINIMESELVDRIDHPERYIVTREISEEESDIKEATGLFENFATKSIAEFTNKYAKAALESNCAGLSMSGYAEFSDVETPIRESIEIIDIVLGEETLLRYDETRLSQYLEDVRLIDKLVSENSIDPSVIDSIRSVGLRDAVEHLPHVGSDGNLGFNIHEFSRLTKDDIKFAVNDVLNSTRTDITNISRNAKYLATEAAKEKDSKKKDMDKVSKKERLLNGIEKAKKSIKAKLESTILETKFNQLKVMNTQSRKIALMAARVVKESTLAEEKENTRIYLEQLDKYKNTVYDIIKGDVE